MIEPSLSLSWFKGVTTGSPLTASPELLKRGVVACLRRRLADLGVEQSSENGTVWYLSGCPMLGSFVGTVLTLRKLFNRPRLAFMQGRFICVRAYVLSGSPLR